MLDEWLSRQDLEFRKHVGDVRQYMQTPCTLEELEKLDNEFINNPGGDNGRADE